MRESEIEITFYQRFTPPIDKQESYMKIIKELNLEKVFEMEIYDGINADIVFKKVITIDTEIDEEYLNWKLAFKEFDHNVSIILNIVELQIKVSGNGL